jgi:hypothetical protein
MREFVPADPEPLTSIGAVVPREDKPLPVPEALSMQSLEHGAYYAGTLGTESIVARWHARRQRCVFWEFAVGHNRVNSAAHVAGTGTGKRFAPLSRSVPTDICQVSDYSFETGA